MTSKALQAIGEIGGPRCCKRNSFTAVISAVKFVKDNLGVAIELPEAVLCDFSENNKQCLGVKCPYFKIEQK